MHGLTRQHINKLHIIVRMLGKIYKPRVLSHGYKLTELKQLLTVDRVPAALHINIAVNFRLTVKNFPLLGRYFLKLFNNFRLQHTITAFILTKNF